MFTVIMSALLGFLPAMPGMCDGVVHPQEAASAEQPFVFMREVWSTPGNPTGNQVPGDDFFATRPGEVGVTSTLEAPSNAGDNYVQRLRGWIEAPATGAYRFMIASDDNSELWLSTTEDPADMRRIARVDAHTGPRNFSRNANRTSAPITLIKGSRYYIEARHCEGNGDDHLSVGWLVPRSKFGEPFVVGSTPTAAFTLELFESIPDADPATHPAFEGRPDRVLKRALMATPEDIGTNVGTRLKGILVPPATGEYVFMVSADDRAVLHLTPADDPNARVEIAMLDGWVGPDSWEGRPGQVSKPIRLEKGREIHLELRHVQVGGPGHAKVGWKGPNGLQERPIGSNHAIPTS